VAAVQSTRTSSSPDLAKPKVLQRKKSAIRSEVASRRNSDEQSQIGGARRVSIPPSLRVFLGSERDVLIRVQSLLVCVTAAMEVEHSATGPYYPDVVGLAADILRRRVVNMDELLLEGALPADLDQGCRGD
jgi:hypothetical protein